MKIWFCLLLSCSVFLGGCTEHTANSVTTCFHRGDVELGMTCGEVWLAANQPQYELISESVEDGCKEDIYRFWFGCKKHDPYLLTFRDCTIADNAADNAAVKAERKRRADAWLAGNSDIANEIEKFSQEQELSRTNKETLIGLLTDIYSGLPPLEVNSFLVKIDYDVEHMTGLQNQQYQQQHLNYLQRMEEMKEQELKNQQQESDNSTSSPNILTPNAYGLEVHSDRYGRPVQLRPDWGGVPGETLQIKPNAYGPGVHSDQYGRPVREYPWP